MGSYSKGKDEAVRWIRQNFKRGAEILDVGACDGKWRILLGSDYVMDAVEIWPDNIDKYNLKRIYRMVGCGNIKDVKYVHYDLIIFGDVLEHMTVKDAQAVVDYAREHCDNMLIAVPFLYEQGAKNGNPFEIHIQPDLTPEIFNERFPGFKPIFMSDDYAYYVMAKPNM